MSDPNDVVDNVENEDEILKLQDEDYLAEQDKKFEELRLKLHSLKEENKRQMDVIINSLDQLMAEKNYIDETLKDLHIVNEQIDSDVPALPTEGPFKVVDYLARITGYSDLDDIVASIDPSKNVNEQSESAATEEHKTAAQEHETDLITDSQVSETQKSNRDVKSEVHHEEDSTKENQTLLDSEKSTDNSKTDSTDGKQLDD